MDSLPPTSRLARSKVVGKTLLKVGATQTKGVIKRSLGSRTKKEDIESDTQEAIAEILFEALGELKGVSVKIAQQVVLSMPFMPPIYQEKIAQTFNAIPPINRALIRKIIKSELGAYPQDLFEHFASEPLGAASLGQVHRVRYHDETFALKIQYPGMKQSIESDLSILHFALKRFAKGENVDHLMEEIISRLYEEVDYEREADNCMFFREHLKLDYIVIPKVNHSLSSTRVLATSLLEGESFESFIASNPSQELRDHYAQIIFDSFFYSLYWLQRIHADPNPGNFIFMAEGKLGLIDFGCVKRVDSDFLEAYTRLHLNLFGDVDEVKVIEQYVNLGMIEEDNWESMQHFYREVIHPLDTFYREPLVNGFYDFKANADFSKRGFERIFEVQKKQFNSVHKLNEQFIFINRALLGYYALFERMEARIETGYVRKLMEQGVRDAI